MMAIDAIRLNLVVQQLVRLVTEVFLLLPKSFLTSNLASGEVE